MADLPTDVPGCPSGFGCIDVAIGEDGTSLAVWQQYGDGGDRISAAVREAGQDWGPIERAGTPGTGDADPAAGVTTGGIPVVSWAAYFPVFRGGPLLNGIARGAHRLADETWDEQNLGHGDGEHGVPRRSGRRRRGQRPDGLDRRHRHLDRRLRRRRATLHHVLAAVRAGRPGARLLGHRRRQLVRGDRDLVAVRRRHRRAGRDDLPLLRRARRVHRDRDRDRRRGQRDAALRARGRRRRADPGADPDP